MTSAKQGQQRLDPRSQQTNSSHSTPQPKNIYDDPHFFEGYKALRQNDTGLNGALEIPAMQALLPNLAGKSVLDLGCGFGDFARYARTRGARSVTALDVSEKMLAEASRLTTDAAIIFKRCPIEEFETATETFDLVVSSMALHYVAPYQAIVQRVFKTLKPGGAFIFSVEHPVCTANPNGWALDRQGKPLHWPLDRYQQEQARTTSWFIDGVVKYHRTVETYVNTILASGFLLRHLGEPRPQPAFLEKRPWLEEALRRPPILILAALRPDRNLAG